MKKKVFAEFFFILFFSVLIFIFLLSYVFKPFRIEGKSMEPYFSEGDFVLVTRIFWEINKNEVVVVRHKKKDFAVKRVIALEGDKIEFRNGEIFVNGENRGKIASGDFNVMLFENSSFIIEKNTVFLLGDNREISFDSRLWGSIPLKNIYGKVLFNPFSIFRKERLSKSD